MKQYKFVIPILFLLVSFLASYGQEKSVREQINLSFSCVKKSWGSANKALEEIQKCNIANSITELQFNAGRAKTEIEEAMLHAKNAGLEADGAQSEAQNRSLSEAEKVLGGAKKYFKKAEDNFNGAFLKFDNTFYEESGVSVIDNLNEAIRLIDNGMGNLKKGIDKLNEALDELKNCK